MFKQASLSAKALLLALCTACGVLAGCGNPATISNASPVSFSTTSLPAGFVGQSYSASIVAQGGTAPYVYALASGSLPGGLVLTKGGSLSGMLTGSGTFKFVVTVTDSLAQSATASFSVSTSIPLSITTATLPAGTAYTAYSTTIAATNGTAPYTYTVTAGSLPSGLTLVASTGVLSGLPTASGTFNFTVTAKDSASQSATASYSLVIAAATPIAVTPTSLPNGVVGTAYSQTLTAANGLAPYTYAVTAGTLPDGLALGAGTGAITGTPTMAKPYSFSVTATDANGRTATAAYSVTVAAKPTLNISPASVPDGSVGAAYSVTFTATGGTAPITFSAPTGSLPPGLTLTNGVLSGKPTAAGPYSFTITATDKNSVTGTANYTLTIGAAGSTITINGTNYGAPLNTQYSYTLALSGGTGVYTVTQTGGAPLPNGITLSSNGVLSGKATATGSATFTVHVTDTGTPQLMQDFTLTLNVVNALVAVDTTKTLATVPSIFYGLHTSIYDGQLGDAATISSRMANDGISMLRYPGGGLADVYHWAQNTVSPYALSFPATCNDGQDAYFVPTSHFGTFVNLLKTSGAQAVITVNYGSSVADANGSRTTGYVGSVPNSYCSNPNKPGQPKEAAAWVAYANGSVSNTYTIGVDDAGFDWKTVAFWAALRSASPLATDDGYNFLRISHPDPIGIKYWEVGNEVYYNGWTNNINAETDTHAPYVYPNGFNSAYQSRAGVSGLSPADYATYAIPFITAMKNVDSTISVGLDYDLPGATDPIGPTNYQGYNPQYDTSYNAVLTKNACALGTFDFAIIHYYPGSYFGGAKPGELLSLPQYDLPLQIPIIQNELQGSCSNAANIKLMMTETSPNNSLGANFPAPVIGLFVLNEMMESLQVGFQNFDWLELHSSTSQANYMDNTFLDSSENPGPSYYGIQLAHLLAAPGDSQVSASSNPVSTASTGIVSYATLKANGQKGVLLINADPTNTLTTQVTISGASVGSTAVQYTYGINTTGTPLLLPATNVTIPGQSFPVSVPPYTAVELLIQ